MSAANNGGDLAAISNSGRSEREKSWTTVYLQELCYRHQYIRSRDTSGVFELPERLRAVNVGLAAALSRLGEVAPEGSAGYRGVPRLPRQTPMRRAFARPSGWRPSSPREFDFQHSNITVERSLAKVDLTDVDDAVDFVHWSEDSEKYFDKLARWARKSKRRLDTLGSELPSHIMDPDLYLCPGSIDAIAGSVGTVLEAVDDVMRSVPVSPSITYRSKPTKRAFVAIRPPGHHCDVDMPAGFCWVNNVAIAAARAFLHHRINRVVILDIDLHHGNGTQIFAENTNEYSRNPSESHLNGRALKIYYGSIHDILSYPCEDEDPDAIEAASRSLDGVAEQYIENIHLKKYATESVFWNQLYEKQYLRLLTKAKSFIKATGKADDVLVLISCGFDASEHEDPAMSRHGRKVPVSFYYQFTRDAVAFAERYARGRIISILEGGYSDRALISGTMAHLCGLANVDSDVIDETWWNVANLAKLEQGIYNPPGHSRATRSRGQWIQRSTEILSDIDPDFATRKVAPSSSSSRKRSTRSTSITPYPTRTTNSSRRSGIAKGKETKGRAVAFITKSALPTSPKRSAGDATSVPKPKRRKIDDDTWQPAKGNRVTSVDISALKHTRPDPGVSTISTTTYLSSAVFRSDWRPEIQFTSSSQPSNNKTAGEPSKMTNPKIATLKSDWKPSLMPKSEIISSSQSRNNKNTGKPSTTTTTNPKSVARSDWRPEIEFTSSSPPSNIKTAGEPSKMTNPKVATLKSDWKASLVLKSEIISSSQSSNNKTTGEPSTTTTTNPKSAASRSDWRPEIKFTSSSSPSNNKTAGEPSKTTNPKSATLESDWKTFLAPKSEIISSSQSSNNKTTGKPSTATTTNPKSAASRSDWRPEIQFTPSSPPSNNRTAGEPSKPINPKSATLKSDWKASLAPKSETISSSQSSNNKTTGEPSTTTTNPKSATSKGDWRAILVPNLEVVFSSLPSNNRTAGEPSTTTNSKSAPSKSNWRAVLAPESEVISSSLPSNDKTDSEAPTMTNLKSATARSDWPAVLAPKSEVISSSKPSSNWTADPLLKEKRSPPSASSPTYNKPFKATPSPTLHTPSSPIPAVIVAKAPVGTNIPGPRANTYVGYPTTPLLATPNATTPLTPKNCTATRISVPVEDLDRSRPVNDSMQAPDAKPSASSTRRGHELRLQKLAERLLDYDNEYRR